MLHVSNPNAFYTLIALALFSLADLRYRTAPGVAFFFWGAVLLGVITNPLRVGVVVVSVAWVMGMRSSIFILPLLFHPSTWMILLIGAGYLKRKVGGADLLVLAGIACLFEWYVPMLSWIGVLVWRSWWRRKWRGTVPALPGVFLGVVLSFLFERLRF